MGSSVTFPIGICGVTGSNSLPVLRMAGFNLVLGSNSRDFLDYARSNDLAVFMTFHSQKNFQMLDHHPATWAWLLDDEPEMKGIPPVVVLAKHQTVKRLGATKPTAVVLFQGHTAQDYARIADITLCDHYPIPWQPLCVFGQNLRLIRSALSSQGQLVAIIQAFDWSYYRDQFDAGSTPLRSPTYEEIRCMTYCALAQGVNGLLYYAYDDGPGRWRMQEHPETWEALCRVVKEVNERLPLFKADQVWWAKEHRWAKGDSAFNAVWESSIDAVLLEVKEGNRTVPPGSYILAVNNSEKRHGYSLRLPPGTADLVPVLEEARDEVTRDGWLNTTFGPYEVHVYGPLKKAVH